MQQTTLRRMDVQILRGVAVIAVLVFHAKESLFPWGFLGVDVFFVISGFVVMPLIVQVFSPDAPQEKTSILSRLRRFYRRRFYRLIPALGTTVAISALLIFLFLPSPEHGRFASLGISSLLLTGNFGAYKFSGGNYFLPNPNPLVHMWSLSAEEQVYILIPIVLFFLFRLRERLGVEKIVLLFGLTTFAIDRFLSLQPSVLGTVGVIDVRGFLFYSPLSRVTEFAVGGYVYFLSRRIQKQSTQPALLSALIAATLAYVLFLPSVSILHSAYSACGITALLLYFQSLSKTPRYIGSFMNWMGDRSYSIYLVHMPLISIAKYSPIMGGANRTVQTAMAVTLSILFGALLYNQVENRFRIRGSDESMKWSIWVLLLVFVLSPILVLAIMKVGSGNQYWGVEKSPVAMIPAWELDPNCSRITTSKPCQYPLANSEGEVLLIGDSHAGALSQSFVDAAHANGWSATTMALGACQFVLKSTVNGSEFSKIREIYSQVREGNEVSCFDHTDAILKYLATHKITGVFVSNRSSSIQETVFSQSLPNDDYVSMLVKNLAILKANVRHLIVLGPNPEFPDRDKFFGARLVWQGLYSPPYRFALNAMLPMPFVDQKYYLTHLESLGIRYIDVISQFCDESTCKRNDGSGWLYADPDHLSVAGADRLKPMLQAEMSSLIS
ncbi:MAG: acyltransferase family protein [Candidatus Nanopelagicaceae bacterium]|nr:acyltransferase family protein [Candidatus Nanopelagicaceae bacterium]